MASLPWTSVHRAWSKQRNPGKCQIASAALEEAAAAAAVTSQEYVTKIPVPRQKYIQVSKVALVSSILPGFSSINEECNFLTICSCLEAILHAEHKVLLEELRLDRLDEEARSTADELTTSAEALVTESEHPTEGGLRRSSMSRFQKNIMGLLRNAAFQELSERDLQLTAALNSDYLLTLPIDVDWKSASTASVIIFRRGYATEKQEGFLLGAKLDYAQSLALRTLFNVFALPFLQPARALLEENKLNAASDGNWAEAFKKWLEEPLPLDRVTADAQDSLSRGAQRPVPRYEAVLSGSRGKLLRGFLIWLRILPPESTSITNLFDEDSPSGEPHLRRSYLTRVSMRDIWLQLNSEPKFWKKLQAVLSIFSTTSTLQEPAFKELVVMHERAGEQGSRLKLNTYTNIPLPDLKVVFPNKKLTFRLLDTVRLDFATIAGLLAYLVNYKFDNFLSSPSAFILDLVASISLVVFAARAALGYKQTWDRYQLLVNKQLYEKTLASDFGVVHFLIDASEEQQLKEAILLYALLLQSSKDQQEMPVDALSSICERYVYNKFKEQIKMPVEDGVRILLRLGLVTLSDKGIVGAIPYAQAVHSLESRWQMLLTSQTIWRRR